MGRHCTQYVATVIKEAIGGDIFEIKTAHQYPGSHKALIDAAKVENEKNAREHTQVAEENKNVLSLQKVTTFLVLLQFS